MKIGLSMGLMLPRAFHAAEHLQFILMQAELATMPSSC